jgi:hypothetical protein
MPTDRYRKRALIIATGLIWCAHSGVAQGQAIGACAADIQLQCGGVQRGEGRIRTCLEEHVDALSKPCKARISNALAVDKSCGGAMKQICAGVKPGRGRILACLRKSLDKLDEACKELVLQAAARRR